MSEKTLDELIDLMVTRKVIRATAYGFEVELSPLAFKQELPAGEVVPLPEMFESPEDSCPCGHSRAIEHNQSGCLMGCADEVCASKIEAEEI